MEIKYYKTSEFIANEGQVEGLPSNPRQWTKEELNKLAKSLTDTPELFEARPLLAYPHEGKYIVLGGNMRLEASKKNKAKQVPAIIFPTGTPVEKLKEIVIKDNGAFGSWDYDELANKWDDLPLCEWGVPVWNATVDECTVDALFVDAGEHEEKPIRITIEVPTNLDGKVEDIKRAVEITLGEWNGCKVR